MVWTAGAQLVNVEPNIGNLVGTGTVFALDDQPHRDRRRLLAQPLHGQCLKGYEQMIVDETLREIAKWPENKEFRTLEPMNRITLNVILRTIFVAEEPEYEEFREIVRSFLILGSVWPTCHGRPFGPDGHSPWGKLDQARAGINRIVFTLIDQGRSRSDVGRAERHPGTCCCAVGADDGTAISRMDISDELLSSRRRGPRIHDGGVELAVRAAAAPPGRVGRTGEGGRRGRQRIPSGNNCGIAARSHRAGRGRPTGQGPGLRIWRVADSTRSQHIRVRCRLAQEPGQSTRTPNDSIPIAFSVPSPRR